MVGCRKTPDSPIGSSARDESAQALRQHAVKDDCVVCKGIKSTSQARRVVQNSCCLFLYGLQVCVTRKVGQQE